MYQKVSFASLNAGEIFIYLFVIFFIIYLFIKATFVNTKFLGTLSTERQSRCPSIADSSISIKKDFKNKMSKFATWLKKITQELEINFSKKHF